MKQEQTFFKQGILLLVVILAIAAPSLSNALENVSDGLQRCALIGDATSRLVCYDQLGGREDLTAVKLDSPLVLPLDDLSSGSMTERNAQQSKTKPRFEPESESDIVKVKKCIKSGGNKKYVFYLEDGQVWKQVSDQRLSFKDCNFGVSIHKDFFGYKMQLEDSKQKFSVSRLR